MSSPKPLSAFESRPSGKKALVTGHTGFTGRRNCLRLQSIGCRISGLALAPETRPSLFHAASLAADTRADQLAAFEHVGFWQPCDTLRDKRQLEEMWQSGRASWRVWPK